MKIQLKNFLLLVILIAGMQLVSAQTPTTPIEVNNFIVNITDSLHVQGNRWGTQLNEAIAAKEYSNLNKGLKDMQTFIDGKIKELSSFKDIGGSGDLRKATLELLSYEKTMVTDGCMPYEKLTATSTKDDIDALNKNLITLAGKEGEYLEKMRKAQKDYAEKNNFKIEE